MRDHKVNLRTWIAQVGCILIGLVLVLRMIQINFNQSDFLIEKGINQYGQSKTIGTKRGKIFDRNGELLAISAEAYSVFVKPSVFKKNPHNWQQLESFLGQTAGYIERRIGASSSVICSSY